MMAVAIAIVMLQPMQIIMRHHSASAAWDICLSAAAAAASHTAPHVPLAAATPVSYQYSQDLMTRVMIATADNHMLDNFRQTPRKTED